MADPKTFEYGNAASEVQFQDEVGKVKNRQGEACIEVIDNQNVGIGTDSPDRKLEVIDDTNPQLRLTHTDNTEYMELQSLSTGDGVIQLADSFLHLRSGDSTSYLQIQNTTTGVSDGVTQGLTVGVNGLAASVLMRNTSSTLTLGTANNSAITIDGSQNTTAVQNLLADGNVTLGDADADTHTLNGTLQFATEVAAPAAPGSGAGGIFYVKSDGIPYYISDTTAETAITGGGGTTYENKTSSFSAAVDYFYTVDSSGGDVTATLPAASASAGKTLDICHKTTGNDVIIDGASAETINGATTVTLTGVAFQNITLFCTGTEWIIR